MFTDPLQSDLQDLSAVSRSAVEEGVNAGVGVTGALLDRPTHHVHILEMNGESFRLATSKKAQRRTGQPSTATQKTTSEGDADPKF